MCYVLSDHFSASSRILLLRKKGHYKGHREVVFYLFTGNFPPNQIELKSASK